MIFNSDAKHMHMQCITCIAQQRPMMAFGSTMHIMSDCILASCYNNMHLLAYLYAMHCITECVSSIHAHMHTNESTCVRLYT